MVEEKEPTENEKKLKEVLASEKKIMKYRLFLLKVVAINRLKEMRTMAKELYNKLDDWIFYSSKSENDAVFELVRWIFLGMDLRKKMYKISLEVVNCRGMISLILSFRF